MQFKKKFLYFNFLTNNINMQKINFKYRKKNKTTNVLSFHKMKREYYKIFFMLGDIVVSLEKVYDGIS